MRQFGAWLALVAQLPACASGVRLDVEQASAARAAIGAARAEGATESARGSVHFALAREQIEAAEQLARRGDVDDAKLVLARAKADAELARALARREREEQRTERAWTRVLRVEAGPAQTGSP